MELDKLEIGNGGASQIGERDPITDRPRRVRRSLPKSRVAAGRKQRRSRRNGSPLGQHPNAAIPGTPQRQDALADDDLYSRITMHPLSERLRDPRSRLGAPGMDDAPA
jgi:hypothetical protein